MDDAEEMRATDTAFDTLGFSQEDKDGLYKGACWDRCCFASGSVMLLTSLVKRTCRKKWQISTKRWTDKQMIRQYDRHSDNHTDRQTDKLADRHTDRKTDGQTERQTDKQQKNFIESNFMGEMINELAKRNEAKV